MKTLTVRIDDDTYDLLKKAADGQRRTLSNFLEYAAVQYVSSEIYVSDEEMDAILKDTDLVRNLRNGLKEAREGKVKLVKR